MSNAPAYTLVAFPHGERTVVATLHGNDRNSEAVVVMGALRAGVPVGSEVDGIVRHAQTQAKVRGEYVDVLRNGSHIATVDAHGPIDSLPNS
jgi:hypothetical protein